MYVGTDAKTKAGHWGANNHNNALVATPENCLQQAQTKLWTRLIVAVKTKIVMPITGIVIYVELVSDFNRIRRSRLGQIAQFH